MTKTKSQIRTLAFKDPPPDGVLPFEIATFELLPPLAQSKKPHRHTFFEIVYVTGGWGEQIIDFEAYALRPPSVFFISPGQVHFYNLAAPLQGYLLLFTDDFLLSNLGNCDVLHNFEFFHSIKQPPALRVEQDQEDELNRLIKAIYTEYTTKAAYRGSTLQAYLHILLVKFQRAFAQKSPRVEKADAETTYSFVHHFKQLVAKHFLTERSVQFYAGQIGLSNSHLTALVKDVTGETPGQIIRKSVAMEAKRLLIHTELSVEQIGYQLNFDDQPYFGRFFKREVGMSPGGFRTHIREKYQIA